MSEFHLTTQHVLAHDGTNGTGTSIIILIIRFSSWRAETRDHPGIIWLFCLQLGGVAHGRLFFHGNPFEGTSEEQKNIDHSISYQRGRLGVVTGYNFLLRVLLVTAIIIIQVGLHDSTIY